MAYTHGSPAEERLADDPTSELWGEHRARYLFAGRHLFGRRVLDIACGAGFGLEMLRSSGSEAHGLDLDMDALREARNAHTGLPLAQANGEQLPFATASIDAVTSFETVEHVPDAAAFVRELARVTRDDGMVFISTPNRAFGPARLHQNNPYHVQEFTGSELMALLEGCFQRVRAYGQWPSTRYRFVPFLLVERSRDPAEMIWKAWNRAPYRVKDGISRALFGGRGFYPGEADYRFLEGQWDGAHDLVAIAEYPKR